MTKQSWYDIMTPNEQKAHQKWMDELEQQYLDDSFIEERAAEETESKFDYYQEF